MEDLACYSFNKADLDTVLKIDYREKRMEEVRLNRKLL